MHLSIIVPAYNSEATVGRAINSILKQTYSDFELIVIDDGSTDGTLEVLMKYAKLDNRIIIITKENEGQGIARNVGIGRANGEFVGFVDADDEIEPNMYKEMLSSVGDADICQCNILDVYEDGSERVQLTPINKTVTVCNNSDYLDKYFLKLIHSYESCNKIYRRSFLEDNDIFFGDNRKIHSEDFFINLKAAMKLSKIVFINKPLYKYYQSKSSHSNNVSINDVLKTVDIFDMVCEPEFVEVLSRLAVIWIFTVILCDWRHAEPLIRNKKMRKYMKENAKSDQRWYFRAVMRLLLILPPQLGKYLINLYFGEKLSFLRKG